MKLLVPIRTCLIWTTVIRRATRLLVSAYIKHAESSFFPQTLIFQGSNMSRRQSQQLPAPKNARSALMLQPRSNSGSASVGHAENCELTAWWSRKTSLTQVWHQNNSLSNCFSIEAKPDSGFLVNLIAVKYGVTGVKTLWGKTAILSRGKYEWKKWIRLVEFSSLF